MQTTRYIHFSDITETKVVFPQNEERRTLQIRFTNNRTDYILDLNKEQLESLLRIAQDAK